MSATLSLLGRAAHTRNEEDMRHPATAWEDPGFADELLDTMRRHYLIHLRGRAQPTSPATVEKYDRVLLSFIRSRPEFPTLGDLTPANVTHWVRQQREGGLSEHTIASRLAALKVFAHKYLYRDMGITTVDLLRRVQNSAPPEAPRKGLTEDERERILGCFDRPTYHDTRDRALVAVFLASGLRFAEVLGLPLGAVDRLHGEVSVAGKGGRVRLAKLGPRALKYLREYLRDRPRSDSDKLWLSEYGTELTYHGGHEIIKRIRKRSGIDRLHWHLFRHGFAQHALKAGAHPGLVQEMLGHTSQAMTRKYLGRVRQEEAARQMPQYAPL